MLSNPSRLTDDEVLIVEEMHNQWCPGASYCFEISTKNVGIMKATFGEEFRDVEWDQYYEEFYARGCTGMYGTLEYQGNPLS